MKKVRRLEISKLFNGELELKRYHCFNPYFENLYYDYLNNKNIELLYHRQNLLKYISTQKKSLLESKSHEENMKSHEKKERINFIRKCLFRGLFPLALYGCHIAGKDYNIHEQSNVYNTYAMINDLSSDYNNDGIDEINTNTLRNIDNYLEPIDNKYYKNTNPFYDLCNEIRIADNISFIMTMDNLDKDIIEIDGIIYSKTGNVSEITYKEIKNNQIFEGKICSSKIFTSKEDILNFLQEKFNTCNENKKYEVSSIKMYEVKTLEEIPTIIKFKENGDIQFKNSNNITTSIAKVLVR